MPDMQRQRMGKMSKLTGHLGTVSGCIGRCQDIVEKRQRSKPSMYEMHEMRVALARAQDEIGELLDGIRRLEGVHLVE